MDFLKVDDDAFIRIDTIVAYGKDPDVGENNCVVCDMSGEEYSIKDMNIRKLTRILGAKILNPK